MKDNFSTQSDKYQKFRPGYPADLYNYLISLTREKKIAWDCGTGNGQVAKELAKYFDKVYATDISQSQLDQAEKAGNIFYEVAPAERTTFPPEIFDLITVAQAIHWFNFELFYKEVKRTIKPGGILAVIGYGLFQSEEKLDAVIHHFYNNIIGPYWDKERKYIDENYQTIPFPFEEITPPRFENQFNWTFPQLTGYLETWSAVKHYIKKNNSNPLDLVLTDLQKAWGKGEEVRKIRMPILLRVGRLRVGR